MNGGVDRRVDDLLRSLSDALSVEPSADFPRRVRTEAARRGAPWTLATRLMPALAAMLVLLTVTSWWARRMPSSPPRSARVVDRAPTAVGGASLAASTDAPATAGVAAGSSALRSSMQPRAMSRRQPFREPPPAAEVASPTRVSFSHVGEFQVPMWTVEVATPFAAVEPTPPPVAIVPLVPVEFQRVVLPGLDTMTLSPPDRGGRETP